MYQSCCRTRTVRTMCEKTYNNCYKSGSQFRIVQRGEPTQGHCNASNPNDLQKCTQSGPVRNNARRMARLHFIKYTKAKSYAPLLEPVRKLTDGGQVCLLQSSNHRLCQGTQLLVITGLPALQKRLQSRVPIAFALPSTEPKWKPPTSCMTLRCSTCHGMC